MYVLLNKYMGVDDSVEYVFVCYFELQGRKRKKIFPKFRPHRGIAGIQQLQCYHK